MSQTDGFTTTRCPSCAVTLKFQSSRPPPACPRCKKPLGASAGPSPPAPAPAAKKVEVPPRTTTTAASRPQTPPAVHRQAATAGPRPSTPAVQRPTAPATASRRSATGGGPTGFGGYLSAHYRASRWHWIVPLFLGLVVAAGLSLLKGVVGLRGIAAAATAVAGVGVCSGIVYLVARVIDYGVRNRRDPKSSPPSLFGRLAHLALVMLFPILPLVVAERFSPPRGWLASLIGAADAPQDPAASGDGSAAAGDRDDEPATGAPDGEKAGGTRAPAEPESKERRGGASEADALRDPDNPFKLIEE